MQKSAAIWLFGGVLLCVLLVDLVILNFYQQCSVYVQLDTDNGDGLNSAEINGLSIHSRIKSGIYTCSTF